MKSVDIVIPVFYGNVDEIENSVKKQIEFYDKNLNNYNWKIIIGINGSKENILDKAKYLSKKYKRVAYDYIEKQGRGETLSKTFINSKADFVCYMDVDLSTDLEALPMMLLELENGCDLVVGSKYIKGSSFKRFPIRYILSKAYNGVFTRFILDAKFSDSQCGFKGMSTKIAKKIVPFVQDKGWFWDTELLYIAQKKNVKFKEIPVKWTEKGNSGVKLVNTVLVFFKKMIELKHRSKDDRYCKD